MENQPNSKKIIINYGLILGGLTVLIALTKYAMGKHLEQEYISGIVGFVFMIVVIVLGIKKFKSENNQILSFGQALKIGVGIALISAVLSGIYQLLFMYVIEPEFINQTIEKSSEMLYERGYSDEQIEASMAMTRKFMNPALMISFGLIGSALFGFIIAAIAGAIMQKREEQY